MSAQIFGLDIGRSYIKTVEVKLSGSKKILVAASSILAPVDAMKTEAGDDLKKISEAIKNCVKSAKIDTDKCVVSIIESQAVSRLIEMPNLTDKELTSAISWEADQYIPLPIKDVNLHYQVILRPPPGSQDKMRVLLVAAPKRVITKYEEIVRRAGLMLMALETESSALSRMLTKAGEPAALVVSFGGSSTEIVLAKEGNVLFSRSVASGGKALSRAIMTEFNFSEKQAEEYKMTYGILEDKLSGKIALVLRPIMDILITEILKALEFSRTHLGAVQVGRIMICGGGAYLPGLGEYMTEKTSMEVLLADPWESFSKEGLIMKIPGQGGFYCVATGLAMHKA